MIQITERWSVYRDPYQWVLVETYQGKDKKGNPKERTRETYHPWLGMAMRWAADCDCESAGSFRSVEDAYERISKALTERERDFDEDYYWLAGELKNSRTALSAANSKIKKLTQEKAA